MELERITEWDPAYDKRDPEPSKNYGMHGMNLRFVLKGPEGAITFTVFTNWHLPAVQRELIDNRNVYSLTPMAADIGYHSPVPTYEGQEPMPYDCAYVGDKPCYYDGSTLNAEPIFETFVSEGEAAMWALLLDRYNYQFGTDYA